MIDDARANPDRLLSSLHMRLVSTDGREYRIGGCRDRLAQAGFTVLDNRPLLDIHTLITAQR